ncbi:MAG: sigma-54-dependent Fis family transcriptional regulator [Myxococcales bacterium]|jgi:two-component system response regulator HydG|nr:sigma-54-dependent Fis family transcriptional regulator [Myxococcales bacterium]
MEGVVDATRRSEDFSSELERLPPRVLVVDDEPEMRRTVARVLTTRGMDVMTADDGRMAMDLLAREAIDVALIDLMMPRIGGFELLQELRGGGVDTEVIIMTAYADVETAVRAMHTGAYHFLTKPFRSHDEVVHTVSKATEHRRLRDRTVALERRLEQMQKFGELIGSSTRMREVYRMATGVAPTSSTVLILGESGTGKELTARAIHQHSPRADRPFVAVNCSAIPENLVESELFGHVRGAFTGATSTRAGLFEAADGGTIFLDEVGDLPPLAQVKVLRALQEGEIKRVGSDETRRVDTRVIAATNVDLKERIAQGRFREDLFYRLCVVQIVLPTLRERPEDIPILAYHFLQKYATGPKSDVRRIDAEAMNVLQSQPWPGNVRELENAIQHAVVFCKGSCIGPAELPMTRSSRMSGPPPSSTAPASALTAAALADLPYRLAKQRAIDEFDRGYFTALLERTAGNVSEAARQAGLDRSNFRRAARKAGLARTRRA